MPSPRIPIKLNLPKIRSLTLRNFSLYSRQPAISIDFSDGVFCLAGANGLGKSTFLAALNYAITGIVSESERPFQSVEEYYKFSLDFSKSFFTGRIEERDREAAEVSVSLCVGSQLYTVTRGMFEPDELRALRIENGTGSHPSEPSESPDTTPSQRHQHYATHLAADIGVASFEQFVFLQHFVFTFDERRHLLFWDEKVLEQALYLAFGVDVSQAQHADILRREAEKADSLARNYNWQATELRKKIEDLESALSSRDLPKPSASEDLVGTHKTLTEAKDLKEAAFKRIESRLSDCQLRATELSARQAQLRHEYETEFSLRLESRSGVQRAPVVALSIAQQTCAVCGSEGPAITSVIENKLKAQVCPLCESPIKKPREPKNLARLLALDKQIADSKTSLSDALAEKDRLTRDREKAEIDLETAIRQLATFEQSNSQFLSLLAESTSATASVKSTIDRYRTQYEDYLSRKREQYRRRDEKRRAILLLRRDLTKYYSEAEDEFVPGFKKLAKQFLGLDLDIQLEERAPTGISLLLEVKSSARRQIHELSESQRFFLDIALRMALIRYMSALNTKGCLLVDTPEGSLDIAYESRAGSMFALFAEGGFNLIMTANINTSRLLISLAEACGRERMTLARMTTWTELSDVQIEQEELFDEAYSEIEKALRKGSGKKRPKPVA